MSNPISAQLGSLEDRQSPLVSKAATSAHEAVDAIASRLVSTEEKLRTAAADSSQRFNESQERAQAQVKKSLQTFKSATQNNPLIVAGAALVVGAIIAALFRRD